MIIYKVTNLINGKIYIGQTVQELKIRRSQHIHDARKNDKRRSVFHSSIIKHGKDNFKWEILVYCDSIEELNEQEKYYIQKYNTFIDFENSNGYNMTLGGLNSIRSIETRKFQRESNTGERNPMYGKKRPDLSEFNKERVKDSSYVNPMKDKHWMEYSDEETIKQWRNNISKACKGLKRSKKQKKNYSNYATCRIWIVNEKGHLSHTNDENDTRLTCGEYIKGRKWKQN